MFKKIREKMLRKRVAYRTVFQPGSPATDTVLADLARFCRANTTTITVSPVTRQVDPLASAVAEGRREVWNRIMVHVNMSDADIRAIEMAELQRERDEDE